MEILDQAKILQLERLRKNIEKLEAFTLPTSFFQLTFQSSALADHRSIEELAKTLPSKGKVIYYFQTDVSQQIIESYKSCDTTSKRARLNASDPNQGLSTCLYVGSSNSLKKRFREHCGICNVATYALKLDLWLKDQPLIINFYYCKLPTEDQEILQNLEDGLWHMLRPVFGKYGGKH